MIRVIPFHYGTAQKHPDKIRNCKESSIRYVACGLDSHNGRYYFERDTGLVEVCHVMDMSNKTWVLIEEIPDTPMNTTEPSVPFNLDEAIADPSRVRQVNNWERRFVEVIKTKYGKGPHQVILIDVYGYAYAVDSEGKFITTRYVLIPKLQKMKTVPKTINDLPRRPFWRKYGSGYSKMEEGKITSNINSQAIEQYIQHGDTYAETLDGPWLPFTKEVACE